MANVLTLAERRARDKKASPKENLPKKSYKCFRLRNVLFVPAYTQVVPTRIDYVGPTYDTNRVRYTELQLRAMGASSTTEFLWERSYL